MSRQGAEAHVLFGQEGFHLSEGACLKSKKYDRSDMCCFMLFLHKCMHVKHWIFHCIWF